MLQMAGVVFRVNQNVVHDFARVLKSRQCLVSPLIVLIAGGRQAHHGAGEHVTSPRRDEAGQRLVIFMERDLEKPAFGVQLGKVLRSRFDGGYDVMWRSGGICRTTDMLIQLRHVDTESDFLLPIG